MIARSTFAALQRHLGPNDVDLFADRITKQLPRYVSWLPNPGNLFTDAFTIPWTQFHHPYLNPPWNLISHCLQKIIQENLPQVTMTTPWWPSVLWFPTIQALSIHSPLMLEPSTIVLPSPTAIWPMTNSTWKLAVWSLSIQNISNQI